MLKHTEFHPYWLKNLCEMSTEVFDFSYKCVLEWKSHWSFCSVPLRYISNGSGTPAVELSDPPEPSSRGLACWHTREGKNSVDPCRTFCALEHLSGPLALLSVWTRKKKNESQAHPNWCQHVDFRGLYHHDMFETNGSVNAQTQANIKFFLTKSHNSGSLPWILISQEKMSMRFIRCVS